MFLRTQQEEKKLFELSNRRRNVENENSFSQNAIWSAVDNFTYAPEDEITFASYFGRYEDLYNTNCANWANSKKVHLLLRKLKTVEHTKFVNYTATYHLSRKLYKLDEPDMPDTAGEAKTRS